ncbi:unnamed protein product [Closterium sp. NIES-64]|nr:unnamed protein product [Closterium sp. NIES-64]
MSVCPSPCPPSHPSFPALLAIPPSMLRCSCSLLQADPPTPSTPQIITVAVLPLSPDVNVSQTWQVAVRISVLLQFVPRLARMYPMLSGQGSHSVLFETAWASFLLNLVAFFMGSNVVGTLCEWLAGSSGMYDTCLSSSGISSDFYGIYDTGVRVVQLGSFFSTWLYSLMWGFQQISTLAGNLVPTTEVGEVVFMLIIVALGLFLFAFLIGNMQNFLQSLSRRSFEHRLHLRDLEQWMSQRDIPRELQSGVCWMRTARVHDAVSCLVLPDCACALERPRVMSPTPPRPRVMSPTPPPSGHLPHSTALGASPPLHRPRGISPTPPPSGHLPRCCSPSATSSHSSTLISPPHPSPLIPLSSPLRTRLLSIPRRVRELERYVWTVNQGVDEEEVMTSLSEDIQRDVRRHLSYELITKVRMRLLSHPSASPPRPNLHNTLPCSSITSLSHPFSHAARLPDNLPLNPSPHCPPPPPWRAQHCVLLKGMPEQVLDAICERLKQRLYIDGTVVLREGSPVSRMFFVLRGTLQSSTTNRGRTGFYEEVLLGKGDFVGEELLVYFIEKYAEVSKKQSSRRSLRRDVKVGSAVMPEMLPKSERTFCCIGPVEGFSLEAADIDFVCTQFFTVMQSDQVQHALNLCSLNRRMRAATTIQVWYRSVLRRRLKLPIDVMRQAIRTKRIGNLLRSLRAQASNEAGSGTHPRGGTARGKGGRGVFEPRDKDKGSAKRGKVYRALRSLGGGGRTSESHGSEEEEEEGEKKEAGAAEAAGDEKGENQVAEENAGGGDANSVQEKGIPM